MSKPRGIRNNNPGNIEKGESWQGLATPSEMTPDQRGEQRFAVFKSPEWGIRAMVRVLFQYRDTHGLRTIDGMINRWAPPSENDTGAYARTVAAAVGVAPSDEIDLNDRQILRPLLKAIVQHENGQQPYDDSIFDKAIDLAGIGPELTVKPAPIIRKDTEAMSPFLIAALPALVESIPGLIRSFGKGEVTERNAKAAEAVLQVVQTATGTTNAQAAVEAVKSDPVARQAATEALEREAWFETTEAGGGGIEGARAFNVSVMETQPFRMPALWISFLLLAPFYAVVGAVLFTDGWSAEIRIQVVTAVLATVGMVAAFWLGSSFGSQKKDARMP